MNFFFERHGDIQIRTFTNHYYLLHKAPNCIQLADYINNNLYSRLRQWVRAHPRARLRKNQEPYYRQVPSLNLYPAQHYNSLKLHCLLPTALLIKLLENGSKDVDNDRFFELVLTVTKGKNKKGQ